MTEEILPGDFLRKAGDARAIGFVSSIEGGQAHVCWYVRDKHAALEADVREEPCPISLLRMFGGHPPPIPDSLMLMRNEKFSGKAIRTRER